MKSILFVATIATAIMFCSCTNYGTGASSKGEIADKPVMQEAFEMGKNI